MELTIVPPYAALLGIGLIVLSARVVRLRRTVKVPLGGGGEPVLERAIRVQANFSEYVPLALILTTFVEMGGNPDWMVHGLCGTLLAGRVIHALGVSRTSEDYRLRTIGMAATFAVLGVAAAVLLTGGSVLMSLFG